MDIESFKTGNDRIDTWIDTHVIPYSRKNKIDQSELEHIIDFLKSKESPKKITRLGYTQALESAEKWVEKINKKSSVDESLSDIDKVFSNDNYYWVKLKTEQSFKREGKLMGHCVASYFNRNCDIYSLRDKKNNPHCTIEVNSKGIVSQIKGKQNKFVVSKYHSEVIEFLRHLKLNLNTYDLRNIRAVCTRDGIFSVNDIPDKSVFDVKSTISNIKKIPNKLIFKEGVELIDLKKNNTFDISDWEISKELYLNQSNVKINALDLDNCRVSGSFIEGDYIKSKNIHIDTSTVSLKKIIGNDAVFHNSVVNIKDILIKESLSLVNIKNKIVITNKINIDKLNLENLEIEILTEIRCQQLDLKNVKISQDSLNNIKVTQGVTMEDQYCKEIPGWKLESYLDVKSANIDSCNKELEVSCLFAALTDEDKFKDIKVENPYLI